MSEKEIKSFALRLPLDVYQRVQAAANGNKISMNTFIVNALKDTPDTLTLEQRIQAIEKRLDELEKKHKK